MLFCSNVICVLCSVSTFGRVTLIERLPKVLTQIIDTVHKHEQTAVKQHGEVRETPTPVILTTTPHSLEEKLSRLC